MSLRGRGPSIVIQRDNFAEIVLTKGYSSTIDLRDVERISKFRWYADESATTTYAKTDQVEGRPRLHKFILRVSGGFIVHHKDHNGLNNCRSNLEILTYAEHQRLTSLRVNKRTSNYRGVYLHRTGKFSAELWINYKKHYLGLFSSETEAALAYNKAADELLGPGNYIPNVIESAESILSGLKL